MRIPYPVLGDDVPETVADALRVLYDAINGNLNAENIAPESITSTELADDSVTGSKLASGITIGDFE